MLKFLKRNRFVQNFLGSLLANYLLFVRKTSFYSKDMPADPLEHIVDHTPFIVAFWHGEHFMISFAKRESMTFHTLISRHGDGEINAIASRKLGVPAIRGSGDTKKKGTQKGGAMAFRAMLKVLSNGENLGFTADVPKISRIAGLGIIKLAQKSGRPIIPIAYATSRRITLNSWDHAKINLPFSRIGFVAGDPIYVDKNADKDGLEAARILLQDNLNTVTERAYAFAEGHSIISNE
jgi:hypothetical protein